MSEFTEIALGAFLTVGIAAQILAFISLF